MVKKTRKHNQAKQDTTTINTTTNKNTTNKGAAIHFTNNTSAVPAGHGTYRDPPSPTTSTYLGCGYFLYLQIDLPGIVPKDKSK
jgi:hypothetical protein